VKSGIDWLIAANSLTIGLETMPRTMDNIGFYSSLGFAPGKLTVTVTIDAAPSSESPNVFGRLSAKDKEGVLVECCALSESVQPACDFTREIAITDGLGLGETILFRQGGNKGGKLTGFALCHTVPLVEGRAREETRVLKLVLARQADLASAVATLADFARRGGTRRVAFRVQTEYLDAYQQLIAMGGRVRWTDLRMTLKAYPEGRVGEGLLWSNWEI
jgi:hypothetical protein